MRALKFSQLHDSFRPILQSRMRVCISSFRWQYVAPNLSAACVSIHPFVFPSLILRERALISRTYGKLVFEFDS